MDLQTVLSILATLGIGGLIGAWGKAFYDRRAYFEKKLSDLNEEKYRIILINMSLVLKPNSREYYQMNDPALLALNDDGVSDYALNKLKEYVYFSLLYASDEVIVEAREFIKNPSRTSYISTAIAMRKHLWGSSTKLAIDDLDEI